MPKVLGVLGSCRKLGNSEVMLREALLAVKGMGAETEILRLTDLHIKPCRGCMACVFNGKCSIRDDDVDLLIGKLREADGMVISAPTYILSPGGVIKMAIDRCLNMVSLQKEFKQKKRHSVLITVAGKKSFNPMGLEFLSLFAISYGFQVVDYMEAYAQGPGEVLLDDGNVGRAGALGQNLFKSLKGERQRKKPGVNQCPVCYSSVYKIIDGDRVECPVCISKGRLVQGEGRFEVVFDPDSKEKNFSNWEYHREHMDDSIRPSKELFMERRRQVKEITAKYTVE
jgi:multimeric flavodoxin WrbA